MKNKDFLFRGILITFLCALFALLLASCAQKAGNDDEDENDSSEGNTEQEAAFDLSAATDANGRATVTFKVPAGATKLSVMASAGNNSYVLFEELKSSSGYNYLGARGEDVTLADEPFPYVNFASVPSRAVDQALKDGDTFTVTARLASSAGGSYISGAKVTFSVISKDDANLQAGPMRVNVFYVGDVGADDTTRSVMSSALSLFSELFASAGGISVNIVESQIDGPMVLPVPVYGHEFYRSATGKAGGPAINIFVSGDVDGLGYDGETLGITGGIPGPASASERSAVSVSIFAGAGSDGAYDSEDLRLLGETLVHETSHFMGLFHPVELSGNTVTQTDPIDDTPSCLFITECLSDETLVRNIMFPSPVPRGNGTYYPQTQFTAGQKGVLNRYIAVD